MSAANSRRFVSQTTLYISAISAGISAYFIWQKTSTERHLQLVCAEKAKLALENSNWRRWWNNGGRELVEREWREGHVHGEGGEKMLMEREDMDKLRKEIDDVKRELRRLNSWIEEKKREGVWTGQ
ncbi:hypothetical protein ACMFMG_005186 [Clarireedia jacksonii]